ncbi:GIY-YIG nuclease family protein [Acetobacterium bakii]|uniref:GIY-YIG domain-containing protein n=1 Tax=Acetobacterium bakii TaxID=52689 RepID=A0A0L6U3Y8_9FIRM|nr:GIY-YIG nuclease family protein [Acetobacterium bakii]KNZ43239.1 hypothetical protein AKG39_02010 [Acetobacterium bakii]
MNKIQKKLNQIPALPGIYKMLDASGNIIYIGKSKCLKTRVKSYFSKAPKQSKVEKMVFFIDDIDYLVTDTHLEAQLLECQLIKKLKPIFNSQMKNDRKYMYLKVGDFSQYRVLSIVQERQGDSFGPFRGKQFIQSFMDTVTHLFPMVQNNIRWEFNYHTLPVTMSAADFIKNRATLMNVFSEETSMQSLIDELKCRMNNEATQYNYERATIYRDLIKSLTYISHVLYDYKTLITKDLLLKIPVPAGEKLFFISKGKIIFKKQYSVLSQFEIDAFLAEGHNMKSEPAPDRDEKTEVDFLNILFSEIQSLPDEWILK